MRRDFFLRFEGAEQALAQAKVLGFAGDDATELPSDGVWHDDAGNPIAYYLIDVVFGTGEVWRNTGTEEAPVMELVPGFHINGRWVGPEDQIPDFGPALVMPDNPACRFA